MKKLICLLVVVLIAVMVIPAIGASDTELIYNVPSSYEVVIPESINLNQEYSFAATKMNIRDDEEIYVSCLDYEGVTLTNANGDEITAKLNLNDGGIVAYFFKGDTVSRMFMTSDVEYTDSSPAGEYSGTTTFEINSSARFHN